MGLFRSYNDAKSISNGPRSMARRAAYRGAMLVYAGRKDRMANTELNPKEEFIYSLLVLICLALVIVLAFWLVF